MGITVNAAILIKLREKTGLIPTNPKSFVNNFYKT